MPSRSHAAIVLATSTSAGVGEGRRTSAGTSRPRPRALDQRATAVLSPEKVAGVLLLVLAAVSPRGKRMLWVALPRK